MNTSTEKQNTIAAMRDALDNSNGLLEELALIGEWGESARGQIAENNAALSAAAENSLAVGDATKLRKALEELVYNIANESGSIRHLLYRRSKDVPRCASRPERRKRLGASNGFRLERYCRQYA